MCMCQQISVRWCQLRKSIPPCPQPECCLVDSTEQHSKLCVQQAHKHPSWLHIWVQPLQPPLRFQVFHSALCATSERNSSLERLQNNAHIMAGLWSCSQPSPFPSKWAHNSNSRENITDHKLLPEQSPQQCPFNRKAIAQTAVFSDSPRTPFRTPSLVPYFYIEFYREPFPLQGD